MKICLLIVALLLPRLACAQSQTEMNMTSAKDFERVDHRLNVSYEKIMVTLDDDGKTKLRASERAWIAYRDAEAAFEADFARGGTMAPLIYNTCCATLTEARIKQLRSANAEN